MKSPAALVGVIIALGIGYYVYRAQVTPGPASAPEQAINTTGVTADLISIGQAERSYMAEHGTYATLDQLQSEGDITFSGVNRRGYNFTATLDDGQHFTISATPASPSTSGSPTFSIDETMQIRQQ